MRARERQHSAHASDREGAGEREREREGGRERTHTPQCPAARTGAYSYGKRDLLTDLFTWQKGPIHMAKETY